MIENSVGKLPGEISFLAVLVSCCKELDEIVSGRRSYERGLTPDSIDSSAFARIPVAYFSKYETELKELVEIVPGMVDRGTVPDERKIYMKNEIQDWVNKIKGLLGDATQREERRHVERKAREEEEKKKKRQKGLADDVDPYPRDTADLMKTFDLVVNAHKDPVSCVHPRRLIHLLDVQNSVGYTLTKVNPETADNEDEYASQRPLEVFWDRNRRRYTTRKHADFGDEAEPEQDQILETYLVVGLFQTTPDPW